MRIHGTGRLVRSTAGLFILVLFAGTTIARAQDQPVTGQVEIAKSGAANKSGAHLSPTYATDDESNVVVWLTLLDHAVMVPVQVSSASAKALPQMVQRNKMFEPHLLVIQAGTTVQFPNMDPFFHNVFSLFNGKRFDLGLYEAGTTKAVRFDRVGVSFLFCNIHEGMNAVVVAVPTPYFAISDRSGHVNIPNVPDGRYQMQVWYERSSPDNLKNLERTVTISAPSRSLETIHIVDNPNFTLAHKNKYGEDYVSPPSSGYSTP
jgi:plastocyanin